jgi:hypothetical protein
MSKHKHQPTTPPSLYDVVAKVQAELASLPRESRLIALEWVARVVRQKSLDEGIIPAAL